MAGGKLTPRQKMINLMYLVFIAMLAMNMSKEVLSAFGLMNEKFESSNASALTSNTQMLSALDKKASEAGGEFKMASETSHKVETITKDFYGFIGTLKSTVLTGVEVDKETGKLPYESMDKGDNIDNAWFTGEGYSAKGNEIIAKITKYKADMKAVLGSDKKYATILAEVNKKFDLADVKNKDGRPVKYLEYHFDKFPAVASLAKLTAWQNDVKKSESDVYSASLGKAAVNEASMNNYSAIVVTDKSAFFSGEAVKGKVYLGRYDKDTKPTSVTVGGGSVTMIDGAANFSLGAGSIGEHDIAGNFNFLEDGKTISIPIKGNYVVVARPNSANISADKMNVVYRGLPNPMTISFAGISDDKVNASAPGLARSGKAGQYNLTPGSGSDVTVSVTGKLPDGSNVSDKKLFRIKGIPAPVGCIAGQAGGDKGSKSRLAVSQITAKLPDFLYDLSFQVVQFSFKVPGQATVIVNGDRVNAQCNAAMARVTRGDQVTIFDIKTKIVGIGSSIIPGKCSPVIFDIQ